MSDNLKKYEKTTATVGVTTLVTVPSGKAMKGRILFRGVAGVNSLLIWSVNGCEICRTGALTTGHVEYSSISQLINDAATAATLTGLTEALTVLPYQREFILNAGDVLTYEIQTAAFSAFYAAFEGVELDAS